MRRLLFLLLLPFPLLAQTGAVTGVALDSVGNTVAGATITVCAQGSPGIPCSPVTASTTSNGQGAFSVTVPVGTYTVTVFRLGVVATSSTVVVAPSNITVPNNVTYLGNVTISPGTLTAAAIADTGLTVGNCVQAATGGLLTTVGSSCGTSSGTVTTTGSPASGNLAKFSGALSVTNADLTGDVTTSGGVSTTMASTISGAKTWSNLATFSAGITGTGSVGSLTEAYGNLTSFPSACGANQFATQIASTPGCTQPSFSNLSGTISSAQFGSQTANTFLAAPNGSSGNPTFRLVATADLPTAIPVVNLASGSNGQCIITSASATVWGSCAGTAGVQTTATNFTSVTANANSTAPQNLMSNTFSAGVLNATGKTIRVQAGGTYTIANLGVAVAITLGETLGGANSFSYTSGTTGDSGEWAWLFYCTVTTSGSSGAGNCYGNLDITIGGTQGGGTNSRRFTYHLNPASPINWTLAQILQFTVQFSSASASNNAIQNTMVIEQLN